MNISVPLLGAVDTAVVGHLKEVYYLGAVSLGSVIFTMMYWALGFFRMSTVGLAAQAHGSGNHSQSAEVLGRALVLALVMGITVILGRDAIAWAAFRLFDASAPVEQFAAEYFGIRVFAAPAAFVLMIFQGWFYGVKNVAYPVVIMVLVNSLNIGLDLLFVQAWGFKSDGVAWATLISQYLGLLVTLGLFFLRYSHYRRRMTLRGIFSWRRFRELLALNLDIFLRTLALQSASLYFVAKSAALGDLVLAANSVLLQMRYISTYALDGFATAAEVLVGSAIGAENRADLLSGIRLSLRWGMAVGAAISMLYLATSPWWPLFFTNHAGVLALVQTYLVWVILEPWVSNLCFIMDGIYVGATASRLMRNGMVLSVLLVFLPAIEILAYFFGNHGMWAAGLLLYLTRTLVLLPPLRRLWRGTGVRLQ